MPVNKIFQGSISLSAQALDLISAKQGLIQSNIANMHTPGYKPLDIPFAEVMQKVASTGGNLARTNAKHLSAPQASAVQTGKPVQTNKQVDIEEEMLKLAENQLRYQVVTKILTKKFEGIRYVIDEGGK